jgi:hypothetical protein
MAGAGWGGVRAPGVALAEAGGARRGRVWSQAGRLGVAPIGAGGAAQGRAKRCRLGPGRSGGLEQRGSSGAHDKYRSRKVDSEKGAVKIMGTYVRQEQYFLYSSGRIPEEHKRVLLCSSGSLSSLCIHHFLR